jgi:hypothetical protein
MRLAPAAVSLLAILLAGTPALAHDFWIEPSTYRPAPGDVVKLHLRVGERFVGEVVRRTDANIERFVAAGPGPDAAETPVLGPDGGDPAGLLRVESRAAGGVIVVGYRGRHSSIVLEAEKFEAYLREEGLERVVAARAKAGASAAPGREIYSRCAKALLLASPDEGGGGAGFDRALGFTLEIVPEASPFEAKPGESLPVRLLFRGKPLEGALVAALCADAPDARVEARTDAEGRARLALAKPGAWLVKAVHMVPAEGRDDADWESFWGSLTFELLAPRAAE